MYTGKIDRLHAGTAVFGVVTIFVAMPDIYDRVGQSRAIIVFVLNGDVDGKPNPGPVAPDIRSHQRRRRDGGKGPAVSDGETVQLPELPVPELPVSEDPLLTSFFRQASRIRGTEVAPIKNCLKISSCLLHDV